MKRPLESMSNVQQFLHALDHSDIWRDIGSARMLNEIENQRVIRVTQELACAGIELTFLSHGVGLEEAHKALDKALKVHQRVETVVVVAELDPSPSDIKGGPVSACLVVLVENPLSIAARHPA